MAPGITLMIIGAIFTFAIKAESSWMNTRALGVILMLGGLAFVARARSRRREVVTREREPGGAVEEHQLVERRID